MSYSKSERADRNQHDIPAWTPELGTRLSALYEALGGQKSAARIAGVTDEQLGKWRHGKARASFPALVRMSAAAGYSLDWLAFGDRGGKRSESVGTLPDDQLGDDFVLVPRYDIQAAAGTGTWADEEHVVDHLAFRGDWLRRTIGVDPRQLVLITAVGESMEPTIRAGDLLLVDTAVTSVIDDAIYVVVKAGHLVVKRLQTFFNGAVSVKSDNPAYVEETISPADAPSLIVAGRVRWIARMI